MKDENKNLINLCQTCPRKCKVNRNDFLGVCNETNKIRIAKIIKNFQWEEPCITGEKGTLAIFFSGCNLRCDYCQNFEISRGCVGKLYTIEEFCSLIEEFQESHSSIDLITPTHFSNQLFLAFSKIKKKIPVVWNTNSYENVENITMVSKFVDVFLADLKYSNNQLGQKFSACEDYFDKSFEAISQMCLEKPDIVDGEFMKQGVVIRHLVLPNHIQNSLSVLDIVKENFPTRKISLMSQFTPNGKSSINQKLKPIEYKIVVHHLQSLKLENGYVQDFSSADSCYIPKFV